MRIDEGLDTGDMLLKREMQILPDDTAETLSPRLAELGAGMLVETLIGLQQANISATPQNHAEATLAPILKKEDGLIDFQWSSQEVYNRLRGFQPWPGIYTKYKGKVLKVASAKPAPVAAVEVAQGTMRIADGQLFIGCGSGSALELIQVQPEGKKVLSAREFINGYRPADGERLG
jgi:methionyl-tRNA formyltransferase